MSRYIHGGERAIKLLSADQPLDGVAAEFEAAIETEIAQSGIASVLKKRAIRQQAVADLYFAAVLGANDLESLDKLVRRYGWLNSAAHRQLLAVNEIEKNNDDDILDLVLGGSNDG